MTVRAEQIEAGAVFGDWPPHAIIGSLLLAVLVAILMINGGHFTYSLDDPYIHLALAENIARGHYGINLSEPAAPSSSILWPFLLLPLAHGPLHEYLPLVINVICAFGTVAVLQGVFCRVIPAGLATTSWLTPLMVTVSALGFNIVGLVFTGMEHSLQVLLALLLVLGLMVMAETRRVSWWLLAAILLGPLIRYENLSLSLAAVVFLGLQRRWLLAVVVGIATALPIAGFSFFLHGQGLQWLPSSVLVKANVAPLHATSVDIAIAMGRSLLWSPGHFSKLVLLIYAFLFVRRTQHSNTIGSERHLAIAGAIVALAHLAGGQFGWFGRYEVYAMISTTVLILYVWRDYLRDRAARIGSRRMGSEIGLAVLLLSAPTIGATLLTPWGASNIYEQQYQMHRLVSELPTGEPVAVNDLGWVSFRNDRYVLDLWGLGSVEAGARRLSGEPGWMDDLVTRHGVRLAMLYDGWFAGQIPSHWRRVGTLHLGGMRVTSGSSAVAFYATDPAAAPALAALLQRFVPTLPPGVRFEMTPPS